MEGRAACSRCSKSWRGKTREKTEAENKGRAGGRGKGGHNGFDLFLENGRKGVRCRVLKTVTCSALMLAFLLKKPLLGGASTARGGQEAVGKQSRVTFTPPQSAQRGTMHVAEMGINKSHPPSLPSLADGPREEREGGDCPTPVGLSSPALLLSNKGKRVKIGRASCRERV